MSSLKGDRIEDTTSTTERVSPLRKRVSTIVGGAWPTSPRRSGEESECT